MAEAESEVQLGYPDQLLCETVPGSGNYLEVEEMKDFPMFGDEASLVEVTHRRSPGQRKENVLTFSDMAELTYGGNYVPTHPVQAAIEAQVRSKLKWKYVVVDEETGTPLKTKAFDAWVLSFMTDSPMESGRQFQLKLKPSGELVIT